MYIHVPKEKTTKLDPSGKKGIFVGYSDESKAYRIYFPGFKKIETSQVVTFDEVSAYSKSKQFHIEDVEEPEVPRTRDTIIEEMTQENHEDHDLTEPQGPVDPSHEKKSYKRRPAWAHEAIQDVERYGDPDGTLRESKRLRP